MTADAALALMDAMLWRTVLVSAPLLGVTLLVGVAISVLQVATQIQEMTLGFVPKLLAAALVLMLLGPWIMGQIAGHAREVWLALPDLAR